MKRGGVGVLVLAVAAGEDLCPYAGSWSSKRRGRVGCETPISEGDEQPILSGLLEGASMLHVRAPAVLTTVTSVRLGRGPSARSLLAGQDEAPASGDGGSFGIVFLDEMLEYEFDPVAALRAWDARLRPGGVMVITTPCAWSCVDDKKPATAQELARIAGLSPHSEADLVRRRYAANTCGTIHRFDSDVLEDLVAGCLGYEILEADGSVLSGGGNAPPFLRRLDEGLRVAGDATARAEPPCEPCASTLVLAARKPPTHDTHDDDPTQGTRLGWLWDPPADPLRALVAPVHVAHLDARGRLAVPADKFVVIEIGANTQNTIDQTMLPANADAFVVTFEPLLDKYGALLARTSAPDVFAPLGFHHPRGIVLPLAIASGPPGLRPFHVHQTDGCSSLLPPHDAPPTDATEYGPASCAAVADVRTVPTVHLRHVLEVWLGGRQVDYLKVDAQGADIDVLESAGPALAAVAAVSVELRSDRAPASIYAGEPSCSAAITHLHRLGLTPVALKQMHHPQFTRVIFQSDDSHHSPDDDHADDDHPRIRVWPACTFSAATPAMEVLLCSRADCIPDWVQPGQLIPGVRHAPTPAPPPPPR